MKHSNCLNCEKSTNNPSFCSRSCAASYNNKKYPKRKPEHKCDKCEKPIAANRRFCKQCTNFWENDITLEKATYTKHHKSSAYALIRGRARTVAGKLNWKSCQICDYDKHVEICHKRPISDFPPDTLISEINNENNLIALCPNCHWEYDHT